MNGSQRARTCIWVLAASAAWAPLAAAQQRPFALDRLDPSEPGSEWFASESLDLRGHLRPALGLLIDWAHDPLIAAAPNGSNRASLVADQPIAHVGGAVTLADRVRAGLDLPVAMLVGGTANGTFSAPDAFGEGDLRLRTDVRLFGAYRDAVTLAAGIQLALPTGSRQAYMSDGTVRFEPRLLAAGGIGAFAYAARLAFEYRPDDDTFGATALGSMVLFSAAAGLHVLDGALTAGPEVLGGTVVTGPDGPFGARNTPVEMLLGAHYAVAPFRAGLGFGPGLTQGFGAPAWRVVASFEWAPEAAARPAPPPESSPGSASHDVYPEVASARTPGSNRGESSPDRDADGILDADDACPDVAGRASPDPKSNGCPLAFIEGPRIRIAEQVKFRTGTAEIDPSSEEILLAVRQILVDHPEVAGLQIEGHTDSVGSPTRNRKLSEDRASAVKEWLSKHGIASCRLSSAGFGQTQPLVSNEDEEGRRQNRRVEFHITVDESRRAPER